MAKVTVLYKRLRENAVAPARAHDGDAGWDLTVDSVSLKETQLNCEEATRIVASEVYTGIAVAIPKGYWGMLCARSSIYKKGITLANGVGVIDSGYTGEIIAHFYGDGYYRIGDKCCQLVIMPAHPDEVEFVEVDELPESWDGRGEGGFGSTDGNNAPAEGLPDVYDVTDAGVAYDQSTDVVVRAVYKGRVVALCALPEDYDFDNGNVCNECVFSKSATCPGGVTCGPVGEKCFVWRHEDDAARPSLPLGTVREYNGRKIVLVEDAEDLDPAAACECCALYKGGGYCANFRDEKLHKSVGLCADDRTDGVKAHWEYVDDAADGGVGNG